MPELTPVTKFDSAASTSRGDVQRIVLMKRVILSELVQHPRVATEYTQWPMKSGHHPLVRGVLDSKKPLTERLEGIRRALKVFRKDAVKLATALSLSYEWVAEGLLDGFISVLVGIAIGHKLPPGSPLVADNRDAITKGPSGRKPKTGVIEKSSRWYVRHRVSGVSVNTLAREYHQAHQAVFLEKQPDHSWQDDRKTVYDGIKEIDRLIKLTH